MDVKKNIIIQRKWDIKLSDDPVRKQQIPIHSESFITDDLPHVRFHIFSGISDNDKLTVVVSKTATEQAKATIKVSINGSEKKILRMGCWMTQCILDDIPYAVSGSSFINIITVECEIAWYGFTEKWNMPSKVDLYSYTKELFGTDNLTDMILIVDDEEIRVHKIILAAQSSVFMSMFKKNISSLNNNRIQVMNVDAFTMKKVIEFLYTGEINMELDVDVISSMLAAAEKFQVIELKKKCMHALSGKIRINNTLRLLEKASACDVPDLVELITTFMVDNREEMSKLNDFEELYRRKPELLFQFMINIIREKK